MGYSQMVPAACLHLGVVRRSEGMREDRDTSQIPCCLEALSVWRKR